MSFAVCCCNFSEGPWLETMVIKNLLFRFTGQSVFVIWRNKTMWERRSRTNNRFIVEVTITAGWPAHNNESVLLLREMSMHFSKLWHTHTHTHALTVFISTWRSSSTFLLVWVKQVADWASNCLFSCSSTPSLSTHAAPHLLPLSLRRS